jgi:hypothetical protein
MISAIIRALLISWACCAFYYGVLDVRPTQPYSIYNLP